MGEKFQTFFNLLPDPVVIVDGKGKILAVNDRVEEITGYKREELLGRNFLRTKLLTTKSKVIAIKNLVKRMAGMHPAMYEIEMLKKDGEKLTAEINATKIKYEGKPADLVLFRDITERKKAEEALRKSEEKLRNIFISSPDATIISDLNGNIIECNQATLDVGGYSSKEELIGKNGFWFIAKKDHERAMKNMKKTLEQGSVKNIEYTFLTKDGLEYPAELSASVMRDDSGNPIGFIAITKDVTERKRLE